MTAEQAGIPDPESFANVYGPEAPVVLGNGRAITLGQAFALEAAFCDADPVARQDPVKRIGYLARILEAGGSLRPEHEGFLQSKPQPE